VAGKGVKAGGIGVNLVVGHNPFGVVDLLIILPRVAPSSQPWALRQNPFGIPVRSRLSRIGIFGEQGWAGGRVSHFAKVDKSLGSFADARMDGGDGEMFPRIIRRPGIPEDVNLKLGGRATRLLSKPAFKIVHVLLGHDCGDLGVLVCSGVGVLAPNPGHELVAADLARVTSDGVFITGLNHADRFQPGESGLSAEGQAEEEGKSFDHTLIMIWNRAPI